MLLWVHGELGRYLRLVVSSADFPESVRMVGSCFTDEETVVQNSEILLFGVPEITAAMVNQNPRD